MSDNMPDFDNMSPEEIMAWMETLAKRQGASEGFTTAADMDIAEIDPNSVVIDEPGYVPYGQESTQPTQKQSPAPIKPPEAPPARPPVSAPAPLSAPRAAFQPETRTPPAAQIRPLSPVQPARPPAPPPEPPKAAEPPSASPMGEGALAWLESLAADQGEALFNLDLSELPTAMNDTVASPAAAPVNPMTWLEDLARSQASQPSLEPLAADNDSEEESEKLDPFAEGVNPMEWLETLAKRQGAKEEELTTRASMNIPAPTETEVEDDDYQPFSFDTLPTRRSTEPAPALENPADWLSSLAGAEGYGEEGVGQAESRAADDEAEESGEDMSLKAIESAIANGTVTREQMQYFLDQQANQLAAEPEETYPEDLAQDETIQPAELPDWLSQLKPQAPAPTRPLEALFEPAPAAELPDWLGVGGTLNAQGDDLESIFEPDDEESRPFEPVTQAEDLVLDTSDQWVEAFDEEYTLGGQANAAEIPEWYEKNVHDPARIAAVDTAYPPDEQLAEAGLPEENGLPAGQPQALPAWATGLESAEAVEQPESANVFEDMPDWLREVEASVSPEEVPAWLVETILQEEEAEVPAPVAVESEVAAPPPPPPAPVAAAPRQAASQATPRLEPVKAPPLPPPVRVPAGVPVGEVAAVLEGARDKEQSGDLEGALADYEAVIRSGAALDDAVEDLNLLVKSYKTTPAVYRVLGDGLMRQGKLQAALNTYREALNQL